MYNSNNTNNKEMSLNFKNNNNFNLMVHDDYNYEYSDDFENFQRNKSIEKWIGNIPLDKYPLNEDSNPIVINKKSNEIVICEQEVSTLYLKPPTPPPPEPIIIVEEPPVITPAAPPLVIRQKPVTPKTPEPLILKEIPPKPPKPVKQKLITIPGKRAPAPPRKVIVERLPELPPKPQPLVVERWLPYSPQKQKVVFIPNKQPDPIIEPTRNLIIEWETPQVTIKKKYTNLGVVKSNPDEYIKKYADEIRSRSVVDQIVPQIHAGTQNNSDEKSPVLELEGDIEALKLVDLDREGLSGYRKFLKEQNIKLVTHKASRPSSTKSNDDNQSTKSSKSNFDSAFLNYFLANSFATKDENGFLKIKRREGLKLFKKLNKALSLNFSKQEMVNFICGFDRDSAGFIDFNEFKSGVISKLLVNDQEKESEDVFSSRRDSTSTPRAYSQSQPASRSSSSKRDDESNDESNRHNSNKNEDNYFSNRRASSLHYLDYSNQNEW